MQETSIYHRVEIKKIIQETNESKTFLLQPLDGWLPVYKAGQFLTLVFETKHGEKRRSYSISSCPSSQEPLSITVKKIDNGEFSRLLNYHAKMGDVLLTSGIAGFFTLPTDLEKINQVFFIAAGSGITPCFSLIKTLLFSTNKEVILIYSNKTKDTTIFYEDLETLRQKYAARFRIKFLFSNISNVYESRLSNWLLPQFLDAWLHGKPEQALFYLCGPFDYMKMAEITLLSRIPKQNIIKENFSNWPRLILPVPPDVDSHTVKIKILGKEHDLLVQYPVNILAEAKKHNIDLPYSCEAGRCGSCAATCTKGKIWMAYNEVLTDKEVQQGRVLVCQGYPVDGEAVVEF